MIWERSKDHSKKPPSAAYPLSRLVIFYSLLHPYGKIVVVVNTIIILLAFLMQCAASCNQKMTLLPY